MWIGEFSFEIFEIDFVVTPIVDEGGLDDATPIVQYAIEENVIDGSLNQNIFVRRRDFSNNTRYGGHDAGAKDESIGDEIDVITRLPPRNIGLIPFIWDGGIAVNAMFDARFECFDDLRRSPKIHIGNPHRKLAIGDIPFE